MNPVLAPALLIVSLIQQAEQNASILAKFTNGVNPTMAQMLSQIPPGTNLFPYLGLFMNQTQRENLTTSISNRLSAFGEATLITAASAAVLSIYASLGMNTSSFQLGYMLRIGLLMLLVTISAMLCTIGVGYLSSKTATGMCRELRRDVFEKVESFSNVEFDQFSTASLITRSTNNITQVQMVIMMLIRLVFFAPILGTWGIILALQEDANLWWIIAVAVGLLLIIIMIVYKAVLPKFQSIQGLIDRMNLVARESFTGMMVVRAFNMQPFEEKRFDKSNVDLTKVSLFVNRVMVIMMPFMMLIMNGIIITIIWFGSHQVSTGTIQVGQMIAFMQYAIQIVMAFLMMSIMFIILPRASVAADRIAKVIETDVLIQDPKEPKKFAEPFRGTIEFQNVSFRYPRASENVLENITFTANPGETTAFIGATGSGKSTIVNLIPRFYEVTEGAIFADGINIRDVTQHDLREKIGFVPQKSSLFSGTIETNLLYANEAATPEELKYAVDISQAAEFVASKPEGMQTEIAQGGMNVSGGQKQRLSIARALVKKPPIYILDDSFSALDFKTDAALRQAFKSYAVGATLFIVSQRVSTIKNAEQIIVLDQGRIVGKGTHQELMESCPIYKDIALSQLTMEELS